MYRKIKKFLKKQQIKVKLSPTLMINREDKKIMIIKNHKIECFDKIKSLVWEEFHVELVEQTNKIKIREV